MIPGTHTGKVGGSNECGTIEIEETEAGRVDREEMGKDEKYTGKDAVVEVYLARRSAMHAALLKLRKQKQVEYM